MKVGDLAWIWINGNDEPTQGLLVDLVINDHLRQTPVYVVLADGQNHERVRSRIWRCKEACVKPVHFGSTPRRLFPSLLAKEMVSVQPMSLPSGLIFYLDE
jgi:hypothetical protein